jgi:hypothetical protein
MQYKDAAWLKKDLKTAHLQTDAQLSALLQELKDLILVATVLRTSFFSYGIYRVCVGGYVWIGAVCVTLRNERTSSS